MLGFSELDALGVVVIAGLVLWSIALVFYHSLFR